MKKKTNYALCFKAFSLIELLIGLIIISCIITAFAPVITKKLNSGTVTISTSADFKDMGFGNEACEGYFSDKLGKTLKNCTMCLLKPNKEKCLSCYDPTCITPTNYTKIADCSCVSCKTTFGTDCCGCDSKECKLCIAGKHFDSGSCRKVTSLDCLSGKCYSLDCDNNIYDCPESYWCENGIKVGQCDINCKTCSTSSTCEKCQNSNFFLTSLGKCAACPAHAVCDSVSFNCEQGFTKISSTATSCTALFSSKTFDYTGSIQTWTAPFSGTYKLEVWGAQGGGQYAGKGGYAYGNVFLNEGQTLYIGVGGAGKTQSLSGTTTTVGGFNGGGYGGNSGRSSGTSSSGGGATHIAKVSGLLKDIGYPSFVTYKNGLIVAGGGGGGDLWFRGGAGGGANGGNAYPYNPWLEDDDGNPNPALTKFATGGTQSSGGVNAYHTPSVGSDGEFGMGNANRSWYAGNGGGGGLFGGGQGGLSEHEVCESGGGGSGYIGGVSGGSMQTGVRSGNGAAKISVVQ